VLDVQFFEAAVGTWSRGGGRVLDEVRVCKAGVTDSESCEDDFFVRIGWRMAKGRGEVLVEQIC